MTTPQTRFNPPPGWPAVPPGWQPPVGWEPDASWPPAPDGWQFQVPLANNPGAIHAAGSTPNYGPAQQNGPAQPFPPAYPPQKKSRGCLYAVLAVLGIGVLFVVVIVVVVASAAKNIDDAGNAADKKAAKSCTGKTYPDHQKRDYCADASNTVNLEGMTVTATPFTPKSDALGTKALCSNVAMKNSSQESQDYNEFDFKVQTPTGDVATLSAQSFAGTLGSGTLIAGATKSGLVCTDDKGEKGQYVFIYKPNAFKSDRGIWLFKV